jgi:ABC-type transport system involved in multi-copper enzyme maturation permease subunit
MFGRVLAITLNTYREAVRARILYGLIALALGTTLYSLAVAGMSLHDEARVVADLGAASISLYTVLVAIVLGATSLHRELELKTIFPILTRELRRHEYVVGKYTGTLLTLAVFIAIDGGSVLGVLAAEAGRSIPLVAGTFGAFVVVLIALLWRAKLTRVFVVVPWAAAFFLAMAVLAEPAEGERRLVLASCALSLLEVAIVAAVATLFSSFSSPFLTAIFTLGIFIVGRSADTLANLPIRVVGPVGVKIGWGLAKVVPNLQLYVPPRPLLLGQIPTVPVWGHVGGAALNALFYVVVLLVLSCVIFRKRDFQ